MKTFLIAIIIFSVSQVALAHNDQQKKDSLRHEITILFNSMQIEDFQKKAKEHLPFFRANNYWEDYYYISHFLLISYGMQGEKDRVIAGAKQMYDEAKKQNCLFGVAQATTLLAKIYNIENRWSEAETFIRETIETANKMLKIDNQNQDNHILLLQGYRELVNILLFLDNLDEIALWMPEWRNQLSICEKMFGENYNMGYEDYYDLSARIFSNTREYDKAKAYCDSLEQMDPGPHYENRLWEYKSMMSEGAYEYEQALYWNDKVIEALTAQGQLEALVVFTKSKARILCKMGRGAEGWVLYEEALRQKDSLHLKEFHEQLDDLRTQYEVDRYIAEKIHNRNYFLFALGCCILLTIALGIWIYLNRKIAKKNRTLVQQIKALTTKQEEQVNEMLAQTSFMPEEEHTETEDGELCPESRMDKLCLTIRDLLLKDKIYQNSAITQELVIESIGTNRRFFSEAFEYCFKMQFKDYINSLRLKDAILLLEQSDMSIEEIADSAGFGTVRTFQRQFSAKYNMSPKEYKGLMKGMEGK